MNNNDIFIGARISHIRKNVLNMNQEPFAEKLASKLDELYPNEPDHAAPARSTIGKWESGSTTPDLKTLHAIAALTNGKYDIGFLLGLYQQPSFDVKYIENSTGLSIDTIFKLQEFNAIRNTSTGADSECASLMIQIVESIFDSDDLYRNLLELCFINKTDECETKSLLLDSRRFKLQKTLYEITEKLYQSKVETNTRRLSPDEWGEL